MKTLILRAYPEDLRAHASRLGILCENTRQLEDSLVRAWSRLDAGWEDYAESGIESAYHEALGEINRMKSMLSQMDEALLQTSDKLEVADQGAVAFFSFDVVPGNTPGVPTFPPGGEWPPDYTDPGSGSDTPPGSFCPIPSFPINDPLYPFTFGYTTPLPGSSTLTIPNSHWGLPGGVPPGPDTASSSNFLPGYVGYGSTAVTTYDMFLQGQMANRLISGGFRLVPGSTYSGQVLVYGSHEVKSYLGLSPYLTHMRGAPPGLVTTPGTAALRSVGSRLTAVGLGIVYGVDIYEYAWGDKSNIGIASSEFVSTVTTDTVISLGPPAAGAAIGTAICPVVGTAIGGAIGLGVSIVWSIFGRESTISWVDDNIFSPLGNFFFNAPASQGNYPPPVPKPTPTQETPTPTATAQTSTPTTQVTSEPTGTPAVTPQPNPTPATPTATPTPAAP